jgi:hypothetical protein
VKDREQNPRSCRAFDDALPEALDLVDADPRKSVEAGVAVGGERRKAADVIALPATPARACRPTPQGTTAIATFMNRIATIDIDVPSRKDPCLPATREVAHR